MPDLSLKDHNLILNILDSINKIQIYSGEFDNADSFNDNTISFDASMMNFIVIGEMTDKLSDKLKNNETFKIDWGKIKGFRNIIAHNYFGIDAEEVWEIIQDNLPNLKIEFEKLISSGRNA